jgi:methionyl aminopeptidase
MDKLTIKSAEEIAVMAQGGQKLGRVKKELRKIISEGTSAKQVEDLATELIKKEGAQPSFKMVEGYSWSTCVNVNEGLVHGIPTQELVFKKGDIVSVDVGVFYKGFHTDTSFTVGIDIDNEKQKFLETGKRALNKAIKTALPGKRIYDISGAIEDEIKKDGYSPIMALVGHGVGRELHEEPQIPCFRVGRREQSIEIVPGMALAIEVMYAQGSPEVVIEPDGWTIATHDGKISALYEETVAVTTHGHIILTEG